MDQIPVIAIPSATTRDKAQSFRQPRALEHIDPVGRWYGLPALRVGLHKRWCVVDAVLWR